MADHFLTLTQQLAAKLEATPGTAETLTAAEVDLRPFKSDAPFVPDYPRFGNDECAEDQAAAADFVSGARGGIPVGFILKTAGAVGTEPACGRFLQACGMTQSTVSKISVGAQSGGDSQFKAGETYSATGGKTGVIEADLSGAGTLKYIVASGGTIADGDTVTANGDSATASGSSSTYAIKYTPASTAQKTVTLQRGEKNDAGTSAQDFLYRIRGAMGRAQITFTPLDAPRFQSEFQGVVDSVGAGSLFTGVTYEASTPPKFINSTIQLNGVAVQPAEITFDNGAAIEVDPDPSTTGGAAGFERARVAGREPTISIAPFRVVPGTLDDLGLLQAGTTFSFLLTIGTTPNIIELIAPKCQIRGWAGGERAGRRTSQLTLYCTRNTVTDTDYAIYFR